jgi:ABC-type phosphate transport system auxiliary subunit
MDETESVRLGRIEATLTSLAEQVGRVAQYMERLVAVEERNARIDEKLNDFKAQMIATIRELKAEDEKLEDKIDDNRKETGEVSKANTRHATIIGGILAVATVGGPLLIRYVFP